MAQEKGRARWRDLHAVPGFLLSFVLAFFVISGMPWSSFWGSSWSFVASKITPPTEVDQPSSTVARLGDLDRFGNKINWSLQDDPVPASGIDAGSHQVGDHNATAGESRPVPAHDPAPTEVPARISLDAVARVAADEGLRPGYAIALPEDGADADGTTVYGSYALSNPWPIKTEQSLTVYVDQFSGTTLARATSNDWERSARRPTPSSAPTWAPSSASSAAS